MGRLIQIENRWYNLLEIHGGYYWVGDLLDTNNNVVKYGIIWDHNFQYDTQLWYGKTLRGVILLLRGLKLFFNNIVIINK